MTFPIQLFLSALVLSTAVLVAQPSLAASHADGFAKDVTGGGQLAAVRPTTPAELKKALCARFDTRPIPAAWGMPKYARSWSTTCLPI
ncbi:hypothetical protein [Pseudomonas orientalis]|uniref:hypothetical protein n=1 Tax=Pseudomonas orientalis TaxID=76758 RepID=UPI000AC32446|nr:hypothetical protein [Pseudomonas orientalis]